MDFYDGKVIVCHRVASVIQHNGLLLTQKAPGGRILPGGRICPLEHSNEALRRELFEQLGIHTQIGRLLFVTENIFDWCCHHIHQLLFIYEVQISEDIAAARTRRERMGWWPIEHVSRSRLYPDFLRTKLAPLPEHAEHLCVK